jgi:hypothetical protein
MVKNTNSDSNKILNQAFKSFGTELKPLMVSYFETLDELLFGLAEKAKSDSKRKHYVESLRSIRVHKLNVLVSYLKTVQNVFQMFLNNEFDYFKDLYDYPKTKSITGSLNANDIEERLFQNNLIYKLETKCEKQIDVTTACFSSIIQNSLEPHFNPICPFVLVSSFAKSIRLLHLDQNIKMILYKHYEVHVISKIPDLYKEIIDLLSSKNVIEAISKTPKNAQSIVNNKFKITTEEINTILNELQLTLNKTSNVNPSSIKKALMDKIGHIQLSESRHINNHDLYCIDFIAMRFQLIADDQNIHDSIKKIIYQLQIPYLRYLTDDDSFIDEKSHPAQMLLDTIHNSSIGWSEKHDSRQIFISKLTNTVKIIIEAEPLTETLFKVILKDYQEFVDIQENEFLKEQNRIKTREQGKARIVAAMKTVDALIGLKTENVTLPNFIKDIIFGPWKNLLSLLLVRYSDTSAEYLEMVVFIDNLISLLNSEQYEVIIESEIIKLSEVYKKGLELVAYNGDVLDGKIKKFKQNLMKHHKINDENRNQKNDLNTLNSDQIVTKRYTKIPENVEVANIRPKETIAPSLQGFNLKDTALLEELNIGVWVDFLRPNKEPVKAQLSWINPISGKYIFVNERGLKVTDKSAEELLIDLKQKSIIISNSLT